MKQPKILIPKPELQIDFSFALVQMRTQCMQEALSETVESLEIPIIDRELASLVPRNDLSALAGRGLRGDSLCGTVPFIGQSEAVGVLSFAPGLQSKSVL